jgi:hypothetical protein
LLPGSDCCGVDKPSLAGGYHGGQVADAARADAVREEHVAVAALARRDAGWNMALSDRAILSVLASYLERYPEEAALLSEPMRLLAQGGFASRRSSPLYVTAGALLVRGTEILLVEHRAYGIVLQPRELAATSSRPMSR